MDADTLAAMLLHQTLHRPAVAQREFSQQRPFRTAREQPGGTRLVTVTHDYVDARQRLRQCIAVLREICATGEYAACRCPTGELQSRNLLHLNQPLSNISLL